MAVTTILLEYLIILTHRRYGYRKLIGPVSTRNRAKRDGLTETYAQMGWDTTWVRWQDASEAERDLAREDAYNGRPSVLSLLNPSLS